MTSDAVVASREQQIVEILWCYPAAISFYFMIPERQALLPGYPVTVSVGVATLDESEDSEDLMEPCDVNLYRVRTEGRNRVVV